MNHIIRVITDFRRTIAQTYKKIISKDLCKPLGRWQIETCNKHLNRKIDLSNEDHCGPCGKYILEKLETKK